MYIISLSCIIYTYCKSILKSPSGRINKKVLYCIVYSLRTAYGNIYLKALIGNPRGPF